MIIENSAEGSVLEATDRKAVGLIVGAHVAEAAAGEVQVPAVGSAVLCTTPVVAAAASFAQPTIAVVEEAGSMEF